MGTKQAHTRAVIKVTVHANKSLKKVFNTLSKNFKEEKRSMEDERGRSIGPVKLKEVKYRKAGYLEFTYVNK